MEERESASQEKIAMKREQLKRRKEKREERKANQAAGGLKPVVRGVEKSTEIIKNRELAPGDKVKIKGGDLTGEVLRIEGKDVSVAIGNIISKMPKERLEKLTANEFRDIVRPQTKSTYNAYGVSERRLNFKPSIDVRGQRADEAMESVSRFIDDAIMVGMGEVKILHGKGNGILKEEIRKYLRTVPGVVSAKDELLEMGGSGITVVKLDT